MSQQKPELKPNEVVRLRERWKDLYQENNDNGNLVTAFITGDQWAQSTRSSRVAAEKEVLTANLTLKHHNRALADYQSVNYTLGVTPQVPKLTDQIKGAERILKEITLGQDKLRVFYDAYAKGWAFGYTVMKIYRDYKSANSNVLIPYVKHLARAENTFFDPDATLPTKEDGRYCGEVSFVDEHALTKQYPQYRPKYMGTSRNEMFTDVRRVAVYDIYYKQEEKVKIFKVGKQDKRADQMNEYEKRTAKTYYERMISRVYYMRTTNDVVLEKPQLFDGNEFPLVFVGEPFFIRTGDKMKQVIVPPLMPLLDIQQLLNNAMSQVATQTTRKAERVPMIAENCIDESNLQAWKDMNAAPGLLIYKDKDDQNNPTPPPQIVEAPPLDASLIQLMQIAKMMLDEVAGVNLSQQGRSEDGAESGTALSLRIAQGDLLQRKFLYTFINAINRVGKVVMKMMAETLQEEVEMRVGDEFMRFNEAAPTSTPDNPVLINSLRSLHDEYEFTIDASPSSQLEKMRSREAYMQIARSLPQAAPYVLDLMAENLDVNNALELVGRLRLLVDPDLRKAGKGDMSEDEYYQVQQQRAQAQAEQQGPDPLMMAVEETAQNNQQRNQLKAQELEQRFMIEKEKLAIERTKLMTQVESDERNSALKLIETQEKNLDRRMNARF